mgnify:CR=1 FL=1
MGNPIDLFLVYKVTLFSASVTLNYSCVKHPPYNTEMTRVLPMFGAWSPTRSQSGRKASTIPLRALLDYWIEICDPIMWFYTFHIDALKIYWMSTLLWCWCQANCIMSKFQRCLIYKCLKSHIIIGITFIHGFRSSF